MPADTKAVNPTLTTERLTLRALVPEDADDLLAFRGDPEVQKYNSKPMANASEAERYIKLWNEESVGLKRQCWGIALRDVGQVVGLVGLGSWSKHDRSATLGYDLGQAHWGKGFGAEAAETVVRYGFEHMNLHRIEADTIADNWPSVRLLEKLGFTREATLRECSLEDDGAFHDSAIYGMLKREFGAS